ncbi:hypothetical protein L596_010229 [Steinernema carpocapsae]|uniref:Uncharacterized protein n=1 Tax=Steinernema carpocapsae TaxID=34508 RepID=A0A4U5PHZ9_STECR|nr:hypothetical protein L596_010229 [Steinernema carpocapsae]
MIVVLFVHLLSPYLFPVPALLLVLTLSEFKEFPVLSTALKNRSGIHVLFLFDLIFGKSISNTPIYPGCGHMLSPPHLSTGQSTVCLPLNVSSATRLFVASRFFAFIFQQFFQRPLRLSTVGDGYGGSITVCVVSWSSRRRLGRSALVVGRLLASSTTGQPATTCFSGSL